LLRAAGETMNADCAAVLQRVTLPPEGERGGAPDLGSVLLVDELDPDGAPIYRKATLPAGDRAEARRQLVLDVLSKNPAPWMVALVDLGATPLHLYLVVGNKEEDGSVELNEFAEHRGTELGRAAIEGIEGHIAPNSIEHR